MKKFWLIATVLLVGILSNQCKNDLDVIADWKDIPVVYGFLFPADSAYYIRVEKAFLDPETDARIIAQNPDSLYYNDAAIEVWLLDVASGDSIRLNRVDGALEGYPRTSGIFANSPNYLYKAKASNFPLSKKKEYALSIKNTGGGRKAYASTVIPDDFSLSRPSPGNFPPRAIFYPDGKTTFKWDSDVKGVYFRVDMRIRYRVEDIFGVVKAHDSFMWNLTPNVKNDGNVSFGRYDTETEIPGYFFYDALNENLTPVNATLGANDFLYLEPSDIIITGGGAEIAEYLQTALANEGLTGAEVLTTYSNVTNGYGILSAKNQLIETGFILNDPGSIVLDSIKTNYRTKHLKFR